MKPQATEIERPEPTAVEIAKKKIRRLKPGCSVSLTADGGAKVTITRSRDGRTLSLVRHKTA